MSLRFFLPFFLAWTIGQAPVQAPTPPNQGPVFVWTLFNDEVAALKLNWEIDRYADWYLWQDYQQGRLSRQDLIPYARWEYYLQQPDGSLLATDQRNWNHHFNASVADHDVLVEMVSFPMGTLGDVVTTTYYLIQGDYESAAYSGLATVIPFASGKLLQRGKYLAKFGDELRELAPDQIWRLSRGVRGELIESIVVQTKYLPDGFTHMLEASRFWPIFDVVKDNLVVSIKTTQGAQHYGSLIDNLKELRWLKQAGAKNGETIITQAEMHLYVPHGFDIEQLDRVLRLANEFGVPVRVFSF